MCLTNFVWTKDKKIYIIDHGKLKTTEDPDKLTSAGLLKRFGDKARIDAFLKGYSKYRNIDRIMEILEKNNWKWPGRKFTIDRGPLEF
jgi:predicted Ser/Thr protein kinase